MDGVFLSFLKAQQEEGRKLAARSGGRLRLLESLPFAVAGPGQPLDLPPNRFLVQIRVITLIKDARVEVAETDVLVGILFPPDYLHFVENSGSVLALLHPSALFHPNCLGPLICLRLRAGTPLVDIIQGLYAMLTFRRFATADGLNDAACEYCRHHQNLFPTDPRPLIERGALCR